VFIFFVVCARAAPQPTQARLPDAARGATLLRQDAAAS
jgi:hypothetical protein